MINYEWAVKSEAELVKDILSDHISKAKGKLGRCAHTTCVSCDFHSNTYFPCRASVKEWFEQEHEPLYKKGDIVVDSYSQLAVIKEDDCGEDYIMVSHYTDNTTGMKVRISGIKKKVGHIEESEV